MGNHSIVDELLNVDGIDEFVQQKACCVIGWTTSACCLGACACSKTCRVLLDEPMSALDTDLRLKIQDYILKVHQQYHLTTILVSHDIVEVIRLSNHVYVIEHGKIINEGSPTEILPIEALKQMVGKLLD